MTAGTASSTLKWPAFSNAWTEIRFIQSPSFFKSINTEKMKFWSWLNVSFYQKIIIEYLVEYKVNYNYTQQCF